ncbi:MAG: hypothetical protein LCH56_05420 [Proteobacteria bacterium]|nr:hypothetical protein [Pseudomonadota bacterium]
MRTGFLGLVVTAIFAFAASADLGAQEATPDFSARQRQSDLAALRNFVYPPGFSDEQIISLENGVVPPQIAVPEYLRLHCGEMSQSVLNPCLLRHGKGAEAVYTVVSLGGTKSFATLDEATGYFRTEMSTNVMAFETEVSAMNSFIDELCDKIAAGQDPREVVAARGGRPRLPHAIAPPNAEAKYQFSNFFQWEKCVDCVGIVAVNQARPDTTPRCAAIRKQGVPRINYFVVDKGTSRGHRTLDDGMSAFEQLAKQPSL